MEGHSHLEANSDTEVKGTATCHCGKVTFEFVAPKDISVFKCNCSVCAMKMNHHFILPQAKVYISEGGLYLE